MKTFKRIKYNGWLILIIALFSFNVMAQEQVVTPSPVSQETTVNQTVGLDVSYSVTNPKDETLNGLGIRIHWNSKNFTFNEIASVYSTGLIGQGTPESDTRNFDNDANTDMMLNVAWFDVAGNWPGNGATPMTLYTISFTTTPTATGTSPINFSEISTDPSYVFSSTSSTYEISSIPSTENQSHTAKWAIPLDITLKATDIDDDILTYTYLTQPTKGVISGTPPNITYTLTGNHLGTDSFTYKVNDGRSDSNESTVSITIQAIPIVDSQAVTTNEDTSLDITLTGIDSQGQPIVYSIVTLPASGKLDIENIPNIIYTPNKNFSGEDSFTFKANNGSQDSNVATISLAVTSVNDVPVAMEQNINVTKNEPISIKLMALDEDGDTMTYSLVDNPKHGTIVENMPELTYTPSNGYTGSDSFTFKVSDGIIESDIAEVNIEVKSATADNTTKTDETPPLKNNDVGDETSGCFISSIQ